MSIKGIYGAIGLVFLTTVLRAQLPVDGIHHPAGLDNIRATVAPTPGSYFRDDNLFYYGTANVLPDYTTHIYLQAPQLGWWSEGKILGANYGADVMVPIIYKQVSYNQALLTIKVPPVNFNRDSSEFGVGDIFLQPLLFHWNLKQFDFLAGAGVWAPTGKHEDDSLVNLGDGKWSPNITLGGTWYPDSEKLWAIGVLNNYEFNCQTLSSKWKTVSQPNQPPEIMRVSTSSPSSTYTLEWEISRSFLNDLNAGIFGYYQKQFTPEGNVLFNYSEAFGIGPEFMANIKRWDLSISLRYAYEFSAFNRPQGDMVNLSIIKRF
jgi:hypothetical protein